MNNKRENKRTPNHSQTNKKTDEKTKRTRPTNKRMKERTSETDEANEANERKNEINETNEANERKNEWVKRTKRTKRSARTNTRNQLTNQVRVRLTNQQTTEWINVPWEIPWLRRSWLSCSCCWNNWSSCFFKRVCVSCSWLISLAFSSSSPRKFSFSDSISFVFSAKISSSLDKSSLY